MSLQCLISVRRLVGIFSQYQGYWIGASLFSGLQKHLF